MDDLLGEDWQAPAKPATSNPAASFNANTLGSNYSSFRNSPTLPLSRTASPQNISRPPSSVNGAAKLPAGDSFGNLLSLKSQKVSSNVSLQERQKQIAEEKKRQQEAQTRMWDSLGSGRNTPEVRNALSSASSAANEGEDDILAAFNKAAPVDASSHFPPPSSVPVSRGNSPLPVQPHSSLGVSDAEDDDPFGLGNMPQKPIKPTQRQPQPRSTADDYDDDDILGDLGRPMIERSARETHAMSEPDVETETASVPYDRAVAELVDMGFPVENARIAIAETGGDAQAAVSWLLQQAHEESRAKARNEANERHHSRDNDATALRQHGEREALPSWMNREARADPTSRRTDSRSPAGSNKDTSQMAQEFGSKFLKGANSLWKASQKQMAKTMSEFQQDRDAGQPKWMQESSANSSRSSSQRRPEIRRDIDVTDEAAMLDMPRDRPQRPSRQQENHAAMEQSLSNRQQTEQVPYRPSQQPRFMQQPSPLHDKRPAAKLSRQDVEDQTAQAYVSPARRKKTTPKPEPQPEPEVDLFSSAPPAVKPASSIGTGMRSTQASPGPQAPREPPKPKAPPRTIPSVSPSALSTSATHRKAGGEAFKLGDYASAHESYTAALSPLPPVHPIRIIVLSNRALTAIKTGDAKSAVSDADQALAIIGASQGAGEIIDLGGAEGSKDMREFYGKALMRKAEALEHLERWPDAAAAWRTTIEAGIGGAIALRGKDRCEKAAAPKPPAAARAAAAPRAAPARSTSAAAPTKAAPARGLGNSVQRPALTSPSSADAVRKLRAANAAAERADDEKFQLADQVDARLASWKGGKADNLRALLQSLDIVLWPEAGWKKVGMSDLVMPNKVKIVYMKAIAKVHPDKIAQEATTEQRMISAAVFSTLNEAWDKFKKDNNL